MKSLRKWTSLSLGAPELQRGQFLNRILKEMDQSEPCRILEELVSLSLRAPELQMDQFLNEIIEEMDQSEPGSS